ncbi:fimbrial protein [Cronobacter muytjensii]|nr:fimbrial protein [Cronobacter muytjensii]
MREYMCKYLVSLIITLSVLMSVPLVQAGTLSGVPGIRSTVGAGGIHNDCPDGYNYAVIGRDPSWVGGACTLSVPSGNYVPVSGNYSMRIEVIGNAPLQYYKDLTQTNAVWIDASKPIGDQNLTFSGGSRAFINPNLHDGEGRYCLYLEGNGGIYSINLPDTSWNICNSYGPNPLPPTPPQPVISCKVNNSNNLDVNLGTLDRAVIPTVPGSGQPQSAQFPVTCTGGAATMKMQLNYTPITVSGSQVVNSSINGLGVAVSYNDKILAPSDITTMQFPEGNTDVTLKFEAVRNPSVEVADIKTGPFTASAVLVMTQQ